MNQSLPLLKLQAAHICSTNGTFGSLHYAGSMTLVPKRWPCYINIIYAAVVLLYPYFQINKEIIFLLIIVTFPYLANQCYPKFSLLASSLPSATVSSCSFFLSLNLSGGRKTSENTSLEWKWKTDSKDLCWSLSLLLILHYSLSSLKAYALPLSFQSFSTLLPVPEIIFCKRETFVPNRCKWKCIGHLYRPTQVKQK